MSDVDETSAPRGGGVRPSAFEWLWLAVGLALVARYDWLFDDSFVYFRTVDNALFLGAGLVHDVGAYVEGYSSPWHTLAALALRATELAWPAIVLGLGLATFAAFAWVAVRVQRALSPEGGGSRLDVPLALVATNYAATSFFTAGNEGPWLHLFAATTALAVLRPASRLGTCATAALPLVRLELGIALVGVLVWRRFVQRRPALPLFALAVLLNGAWLVFRVRTYADVLPNTFHLKAWTELEEGSRAAAGLRYAWDAVTPYGTAVVLVLGAFLAVLRRSRIAERAALVGIAAAVALPVIASGGSSMHYYYLAFPITLAVLSLGGLVDELRPPAARIGVTLALVVWTLAAYPATLSDHPLTGRETQVVLPSESVITDPSFFRRRPALDDPWPTPDAQRAFRPTLEAEGYRSWTDSGWCNAIYAHYDVRSVHPYGLTDAFLARVVTPEVKRGHKPALARLALDLIEVERNAVANGGKIGRGVYTDAIRAGTAPRWMTANAEAFDVLERKAFNGHDLVENLRLALRGPVRIELDGGTAR